MVNMFNKKIVNLSILLIVFLSALAIISAGPTSDSLHINIQSTYSDGSIETGTFVYTFNITTVDDCSGVVYSNVSTLTTDSRGIISYYLENINLSFDQQYYLCYYRDGVLKSSNELAKVPYAFRTDYWDSYDSPENITYSDLYIDFWDADVDLNAQKLTNVGELILQGVITSRNIFPYTTNLYSLGNSTNWFKELYVRVIYSENITADYLNSTNIEAQDINTGNLDSGNVNISDNLTISGYEIKEKDDSLVIILK